MRATSPHLDSRFSRQSAHCSVRDMDAPSPVPEPWALQKEQPEREMVPSRLGQQNPASRGIFLAVLPKMDRQRAETPLYPGGWGRVGERWFIMAKYR